MSMGWQCPHCGRAHAPHVLTCPKPAAPSLRPASPLQPTLAPWSAPRAPGDEPPFWPLVTCTDIHPMTYG